MNRLLLVLCLLTASIGAVAQTPPAQSGLTEKKVKAAADDRMGRILAAAENRLAGQLDHWFDIGDFPLCGDGLRLKTTLDPRDYEAFTDLIWMLGNIEDREGQMAEAIRFRSLNPENPDALFPQAQLYFFQKRYVDVIPLLERAIAYPKPPQRSAFVLLAQSWRRLGFLRQAIRVWNRQLEVYPGDPAALKNIQQAQTELLKPPG